MKFAGTSKLGRLSTSLAALGFPPYYGKLPLRNLNKKGYISPSAVICHQATKFGAHIYIDDHVLLYQDNGGGFVEIGDNVHIHRDTIIQTGSGGTLTIGEGTHIQPRCQFSAYKGPITIGLHAEIAPACAFYPYDHGMASGLSVREQQLKTKGGIRLEDDVWLGYGVVVLDGVCIGRGAVIGAGSVVTSDIPENGIAVGNPARIIRTR